MITTSSSPDAREYVKQIGKKIVLIDGRELADMIDFGVGVETKRTYEVKELDTSYSTKSDVGQCSNPDKRYGSPAFTSLGGDLESQPALSRLARLVGGHLLFSS
jgi:hypothetical protein